MKEENVEGIVGNYFVIKAVIIHTFDDIETFHIGLTPAKYWFVRKRLEAELEKAINILRELKNRGLINSMSIPKNKPIQHQLNNLVKAKKIIRNSLRQMREFYK